MTHTGPAAMAFSFSASDIIKAGSAVGLPTACQAPDGWL